MYNRARLTHPADKRTMHIGIYADYYKPASSGGIDQFFTRSVTALAEYAPQHRYTVLAQPKNSALLRELFAAHAITVHELNPQVLHKRVWRVFKRQIPFLDASQRAQINTLGFDVVHFPRQRVYVEGLHTPVALTLFDIQHEYYPQFFPTDALAHRTRQYRASVAAADCVIVAADFTAQTLRDKMPELLSRVERVYPGISHWQPREYNLAALRDKYNLPEAFLLYPANMWIHKNHARLIAALRWLRERHTLRVPLVLTGRVHADKYGLTQQLSIAAGVEEQIHDLGFVPAEEMPALYQAARALVFPSLFEGFGFPVLEAQQQGCPVLCANATTLPDIAGEGARLFDPHDTTAIGEAIAQVWQDADLRQSLVERGKRNIERFSWERYAAQMIEIFASLVR